MKKVHHELGEKQCYQIESLFPTYPPCRSSPDKFNVWLYGFLSQNLLEYLSIALDSDPDLINRQPLFLLLFELVLSS